LSGKNQQKAPCPRRRSSHCRRPCRTDGHWSVMRLTVGKRQSRSQTKQRQSLIGQLEPIKL
jgi:hypothetical protein